MEITAIKVHVNASIYEIIKDIQQNLRKKEGKKTSLAEIILRLVQKSIETIQNEHEYEQNTQNNDNSVQYEDSFVQNSKHFTPKSTTKSIIISSKDTKFQDELNLRQEYLSDKEGEIREVEAELYNEREKLIDKNRELLKLEEELMRKQYNLKYKSIEKEVLSKVDTQLMKVNHFPETIPYKPDNINNELSRLIEMHFEKILKKIQSVNEQLSDIKRETKSENFTKYLDLLLENDNKIIQLIEKSNQKTTLQKLEPMLPATLTAIVSFVMKNREKINTTELANEIKALMAEIKEDKETL